MKTSYQISYDAQGKLIWFLTSHGHRVCPHAQLSLPL